MPRKNSIDRAVLRAAVAFEIGRNKRQQVIGNTLRISQSEVSRLRSEAEEHGWLGPPSFRVADHEVWRRAEELFYSTGALCDELRRFVGPRGRLLHRIVLLHTGYDGRIDAGAVAFFGQLFRDARTVGVTWGRTISRVVDALQQRNASTPVTNKSHPVTFVPLCGEPLADGDPSSHSSSVLAQRLTEIFNGGSTAVSSPSIAGVQAFIPLKVGQLDKSPTIQHLFSMVRGHARVFGTPDGPSGNGPPLVQNLSGILTSIGRVDRDRRGTFLTERIQVGDISEEQMLRSVAGDIGGVIIPKSGIRADDEQLIDAMNRNWTGVRLEHLHQCAKAALADGFGPERPGVVVLALGAERVQVVLRCLQLGIVNQLVINKALADGLTTHLQSG